MDTEDPVEQRKKPRQERARATVDAILIAAAHILKTEGLERATTNRIAVLAGVSIGSLYQYFPNKLSIVAALRERNSDWFNECMLAGLARLNDRPLRRAARTAVELAIALHAVDPEMHNALSDRHTIEPHVELEFRRLFQTKLEGMRADIRPVDAELASYIIIRALGALIHGTALDEPERLADPHFAEEVTELVVRYLEP